MKLLQMDLTQVLAPTAAPTDSVASSTPGFREGLAALRDSSFSDLISDFSGRIVSFAIDLAIAIAVFYLGKFVIKRLYKMIATILVRRNVDHSLSTFVLSFVKIVLYFILIVTVIGIVGIETSSFLALFASAGVAIGMALSGTLQNFAGGVLILLLKPYKVGDYIEAQGFGGIVREIQIFHTLIATPDNKAIMIPNGGLSTSSINNWSREDVRRISWNVSISYGDNVEAARKAILGMFANDERIIWSEDIDGDGVYNDEYRKSKEPVAQEETVVEEKPRRGLIKKVFGGKKVRAAMAKLDGGKNTQTALKVSVIAEPVVLVSSLGSSSVDLEVRAWVLSKDYWGVYHDYNERIYTELPSHGINFPYPHMDVLVKQQA